MANFTKISDLAGITENFDPDLERIVVDNNTDLLTRSMTLAHAFKKSKLYVWEKVYVACSNGAGLVQAVADSTDVPLTWDTDDFDGWGMHTTNSASFTIYDGSADSPALPTLGIYDAFLYIDLPSSSSGKTVIRANVNSNPVYEHTLQVTSAGAGTMCFSCPVEFTDLSDTFYWSIFQTSGGSVNVKPYKTILKLSTLT